MPDFISVIKSPVIRATTGRLTRADRWDHFLARAGIDRNGHRVEPGLYALGNPTPDSPVVVTANYTLSFDALRSHLSGIDCYILVLDTRGINVWCAAGKGTFGTGELVYRIETTGLHDVVSHRVLILPQLGATGVAAHLVKQRTGFRVEYGPVRASDLPEYLSTHRATPEMRQVRFTLADRLVLIPVELVKILLPLSLFALIMLAAGNFQAGAAAAAAVLAGVVLFPILLPWLPTQDFTTKGLILGILTALPFALNVLLAPHAAVWLRGGKALAYFLVLPPVTAFFALNFTGSTTFTSVSGVRREIFTYVPLIAWMFGSGVLLMIILIILQLLGGV